MENNKSPGNDGITKEFYITFWNEVKVPYLLAIGKAYLVKQLSASQKQAVIKLIEKKGRDKRYIQNWRPISLLNVDVKLISKALAERLKNVLPEIISPNQNAYVKNRCISEGGRLISDLLEMSEVLNKESFLVTIDIEKAFDSVNHHFLIPILEKIGFGTDFIEWIKVLLNNQQSCVINPLNANPEKWSNTLKQIVGNLPTIRLSVFDHFMNLARKGLTGGKLQNTLN